MGHYCNSSGNNRGFCSQHIALVEDTGPRKSQAYPILDYCVVDSRMYILICISLISAVMNFATIGCYVQLVGNDSPGQYAQGFWMTICSATISSICAVLLALNSFILPEFGKRGKMGLSGPQRVFVVQIMIFIFWLAVFDLIPRI